MDPGKTNSNTMYDILENAYINNFQKNLNQTNKHDEIKMYKTSLPFPPFFSFLSPYF